MPRQRRDAPPARLVSVILWRAFSELEGGIGRALTDGWTAFAQAQPVTTGNRRAPYPHPGRELCISLTSLVEARSFRALDVLEKHRKHASSTALDDFSVLPPGTDELVDKRLEFGSATVSTAAVDDR